MKSRSPSCAAGGVALWEEDGSSRHEGVGLLAQVLRELAPGLPVIDEAAFEDAGQRAAFFRNLR
jgi:uncharacterized protein YbbK (DUF523 family)